jgi:siroheme synthase-like protein
MEIKGQKCLVAGGGIVALRKIEKLLPFGADITVVSPAFCSEIEEMDGITRIRRKFEKEDINGMLFVIGATDDEKVNAEISALCRENDIPVNIVDDPKKCTFFFPALVKQGEFVAGFSTGGGSPLAAQYIRKKVEDAVPEGFDKVVEVLSSVREQVKAEIPDSKKRENVFKEIFALALEQEGKITEEELNEIIRKEGEHA